MKSLRFVLFSFFACSLFLTSCLSDQCNETRQFVQYDPVYMTASQFRVDVKVEGERNIENPGKMYFYENMIFINEQGQGIHIFDNADRTNPKYLAYYKIAGNFDISIKDDLLIADNVIDLITIDISDLQNPEITSRIKDHLGWYTYWEDDDTRQYIAYSVPTDRVETLDCSNSNFNNQMFFRNDNIFVDFAAAETVSILSNVDSNNASTGSTGIGGSTARFTITGDYLYTVSHSNLTSYKINAASITKEQENNLGWGIETIFPFKDKLFIGSNSGMFIYSLEDPASPYRLSSFEHARACDPVVANDNHAFVTLRNGSECQGFINQLDVIDIENITSPKLVKSFPMTNPHGLSLNGNYLYLSEGNFGMKVLDIENPSNVKEISFDNNIASTDVIYLGNDHLLSIGKDGLTQYDVSNPKDIKRISHIAVEK